MKMNLRGKKNIYFKGICGCLVLRESSFSIQGTGAEDFWKGYETLFHYTMGVRKISRAIFTGYKTILLQTTLNEVVDQRWKEKLADTGNDGSFERYESRLGQLCICPYINVLCAKMGY